MLKHALSSSGQGPKNGYIQDPRGWTRPPDGLGRPPEALGRPPESLGRLPESLGRLPESLVRLPDSLGRLPDSLGRLPESLGRLPEPLIRPPPQLNRTYGGRSATPPHLQANRSFHQPNPYASLPQRNGGLRAPHPFQDPKPINPYGLNASALSASKHSLGGNSSSVSPLGVASVHSPRLPNGCPPRVNPAPPPLLPSARLLRRASEPGVREMLTSLGLLCLVSLLLALLSLVFMLKISPAQDVRELAKLDQVTVISPDEYVLVYEVTLALCAFSLSLNLCCLLVCSVQFLFSVKLVRDSPDGERTNKYLKKSAFTRVCAVGGFFVSIPVFLTGIILYTFIQFHSTPAIVTSVLIGMGIMFCGCAMVHNVFLWQKEKTNAVRALAQEQRAAMQSREQSLSTSEQSSRAVVLGHHSFHQRSVSPPPLLPSTMLDTPTPPEICTLV